MTSQYYITLSMSIVVETDNIVSALFQCYGCTYYISVDKLNNCKLLTHAIIKIYINSSN